MDDLRQLTAGQKAVVDAYLANYRPAEEFNPDTDVLVDTQQLIYETGGMCNFDENMLCDYLAEKGYRAHFEADDAVYGWILRERE